MSSPAGGPPRVESVRYGLIAVVVTAAIVTVVLAATFLGPAPPSSMGCTALECGSTVAIGSPQPEGGPGNYSYVMGVTPSDGLTWGQTHFGIVSATGHPLTPSASWSVWISSNSRGSGPPVATYSFSNGVWGSGAHVTATSGQTIVLALGPSDLRGQGDTLVLTIDWGTGSPTNATTSVALP
jgi:hypothetical protein